MAKFSISSLVAFLAIGGFTEWWLARYVDKVALDREVYRLKGDGLVIASLLAGENLNQGITTAKFHVIDKFFGERALSFNTINVNVYSPGGQIVYSNLHQFVGKQYPENKEMKRALKGETVTRIIRNTGENFGEWESSPELLSAYVPLRLDAPDKVSGVYEAQIDITFYLHSIRAQKRHLWLTVGAGFILLYFGLFLIAKGASRTISRQQRSLAEAYEAEKERSAELALLLNTSQAISSSLNLAEILDSLAEQMVEQIGVTFCRILLLDRTAKRVSVHAAYSIRELNWDPKIGSYFEVDSLPLFKQAIEERRPRLLFSEEASQEITTSEKNLTFDAGADAKSVLVIPIVAKESPLGVVTVGESRGWERSSFSSSRISLAAAMASHAAVAIENAMLFADRERAHIMTLETLVAALDAREHETRDHSRRVANRTIFLASQMEIDSAAIPYIYRGALLHDVGKIGIPDNILLKNGPLTKDEWAIMKKHPEIAYNILKDAKFLGVAREMVLCHHERYDGSGYPGGLRGADIPLGARVFAVIDALDAITYNRPYSAARAFVQAQQEIIKGSGSQFDPQVVEAFLKIPEETILSIS